MRRRGTRIAAVADGIIGLVCSTAATHLRKSKKEKI
jgi:hypothetical protein